VKLIGFYVDVPCGGAVALLLLFIHVPDRSIEITGKGHVRMVKSTMLNYIVLQCGYHYLSMFLTIYQPPGLTTEPATWHFNRAHPQNPHET
jgi:hypothetical protein